MLSSHSTQTKDPSLFALCQPGATAPCGRPAGGGVEEGDADFGALIATLQPAEPAVHPESEPDLSELAAGVAALGLAVPPAPVVLGPPAAGVDGEPADIDLPPGGTGADSESDGGAVTPRAVATGRAFGRPMGDSVPGPVVARDLPRAGAAAPANAPGPAETAAERARQTPRYAGLPAVALDHRQAQQLPPGLTRWQAPLVEPTAAAPTEAALPSAADRAPGRVAPLAGTESESSGSWPGRFGDEGKLPPGLESRPVVPAQPEDATASPGRRSAPVHAAIPAAWNVQLRPPPRPEEKIAARRETGPDVIESLDGRLNKTFLATNEALVAKHNAKLGTDSAKSGVAMPAASFTPPSTPAGSDLAILPGVATVADVEVVTESSERFRTAHEAVEVVLHAVEHVASREQKSVHLKFSVAGEELAVRVELRADEVRTTFRTDSAELRAALAQEWQAVSSGTTPVERPVRIAPAVFMAAEQSALNAFSGDSSSRGRQAGVRQDEAARAVTGLRSRRAVAATDLPLPQTGPTPLRSDASHRLHTLA